MTNEEMRAIEEAFAEASDKPAAWVAYADNGNIRFWTTDADRAQFVKENGVDLRPFTLAQLVALTSGWPLENEWQDSKLAGLPAQRKPACADGDIDYAEILRLHRKYRANEKEPLWKVFVRVGQAHEKAEQHEASISVARERQAFEQREREQTRPLWDRSNWPKDGFINDID